MYHNETNTKYGINWEIFYHRRLTVQKMIHVHRFHEQWCWLTKNHRQKTTSLYVRDICPVMYSCHCRITRNDVLNRMVTDDGI